MRFFNQPRIFAGLSGLALTLAALACGGLTPPAQTSSPPAQTSSSPATAVLAESTSVSTATPGKIPNLAIQLAWSGESVTLPAPIDPDRTIYRTPQYRRWQYGGSSDELTYVDPSGVKYVIKAVGKSDVHKAPSSQLGAETKSKPVKFGGGGGKSKKKKKKGKSAVTAGAGALRNTRKMVISRYRVTSPTLENVTTYDHQGRLESWVTYGPDGATREVKVQMREREFCPDGVPLIQTVCFYEPDRIRQLQINAQNVAWQEVETGEAGNIRKRLHEDPSKADKLQLRKR